MCFDGFFVVKELLECKIQEEGVGKRSTTRAALKRRHTYRTGSGQYHGSERQQTR